MMLGFIVDGPGERRGLLVAHEGVGVGIEKDHARLAADRAFEQNTKRLILFGQWKVGPDLGRGVAQPHGIDVAGNDIGVGLAVKRAGKDRGVEGIGKAVLKDGRQRRIADARLDSWDQSLDSRARKVPVSLGRPGMGQ